MNLQELRARLAELVANAKTIRDAADAEKRDLTKEEADTLDGIMADFDATELQIQRKERIDAMDNRVNDTTSAGRQTVPQAPVAAQGAPEPTQPAPARRGMANVLLDPANRQRWGWNHFGDFCSAVRQANQPGASMDPRLLQAAALSTYGNEGVGADGGFAVPPEWRAEIMQLVAGEDSLLSMTDQQTCSGNSITFPADETTAWQSTGGIQAYWDSEAAAMTQSKVALKELSMKLSRLTALVPMTDELLEDSVAMGGYVSSKAGEKLNFKVTDAIVNGTGAGMPLGIMNSNCLVTVSKEGSQTADTLHANNVAKMIARMPSGSYGRASWLVNQDVLPQIMKLGFVVTSPDSTTVGGAGAIWMPPGGLNAGAPFGTISGRPIIVTEACAAIGDLGDVILADLSKYLTIVKAGGIKSDVSIHLYFDQNTTCFRFVLRMNGQPWLSSAIARKNGNNTLSHFVTLEAR